MVEVEVFFATGAFCIATHVPLFPDFVLRVHFATVYALLVLVANTFSVFSAVHAFTFRGVQHVIHFANGTKEESVALPTRQVGMFTVCDFVVIAIVLMAGETFFAFARMPSYVVVVESFLAFQAVVVFSHESG